MNSLKSIVKQMLNENEVANNGNIAIISSHSDSGIVHRLKIFTNSQSAESYFWLRVNDYNNTNHLSEHDKDSILEDGYWEGRGFMVQIFHF